MPSVKVINVKLKLDGTCEIDAKNFSGKECISAIDELVNSLSADVTKNQSKPELRVPMSNIDRQRNATR